MHDSCMDSVRIMHEKLISGRCINNQWNEYGLSMEIKDNARIIWHSKGWNQKINGSCMNQVWAELGLCMKYEWMMHE